MVELKTVRELDAIDTAQCLNYLKATGLKICLLVNFSTPKIQIKRLVHPQPLDFTIRVHLRLIRFTICVNLQLRGK